MKKIIQIIGIDYSYNSPAVSSTTNNSPTVKIHYIKKSKKGDLDVITKSNFTFTRYDPVESDSHFVEKYIKNSKLVTDIIDPTIPKEDVYFFFENYAFGVTTNVLTLLAENAGVLKLHLYQMGYRNFTLLSPQTIKKFATGSGRSKKDQMYDSFVPQTGIDLSFISKSKKTSPVSDIVDAYYIMSTGEDWLDTNS